MGIPTSVLTTMTFDVTSLDSFYHCISKKSDDYSLNIRLIKNYKRHKFLNSYDFKIEFVELFGDKK